MAPQDPSAAFRAARRTPAAAHAASLLQVQERKQQRNSGVAFQEPRPKVLLPAPNPYKAGVLHRQNQLLFCVHHRSGPGRLARPVDANFQL